MSKLTKEEKKELRTKAEYCAFTEASGGDTEADYDELELWVSQKKKEWQKEAIKEPKEDTTIEDMNYELIAEKYFD